MPLESTMLMPLFMLSIELTYKQSKLFTKNPGNHIFIFESKLKLLKKVLDVSNMSGIWGVSRLNIIFMSSTK